MADKPPMNGEYGTKYNAEAVQQAINKDKRIKGGEGKKIHALLKGWRGDDILDKIDAMDAAIEAVDRRLDSMERDNARMDAHPDTILRNELNELRRRMGSGDPASQNKWRARIQAIEEKLKKRG